jgi:hypothetical protein
VSKVSKAFEKLKNSASDGNWTLDDLISLIRKLGFEETSKISGRKSGTSHRKFKKDGVTELINLQDGGGAKKYQVRQIREIVEKYSLKI